MAGQRQQGWGPERHTSRNPDDGIDVPISVPGTPQAPMDPAAQDDQQDGVATDTVSKSRTTTSSIWYCEPMRDAHESIREVGGRQYNAQNTAYFLPAGKST